MASPVTHISTITPSGSSTDIEFTSIPATYDDLLLIGTLKGANTGAWTPSASGNRIVFGEGSTYWGSSGDYNYQMLYDEFSANTFLGYQNNYTGAGASTYISAHPIPGSSGDADNPAGYWLYVPGYAVTTNTPGRNWQLLAGCLSTNSNAHEYCQVNAGMVEQTAAIDKIKFSSGVGNFTASSKMSLYGIKNS